MTDDDRTDAGAQDFTLRDADLDIAFTGWLLGEATSQDAVGSRPRWTDVRVYATIGGAYIVNIVGRTSLPGEDERSRTRVCETAAAAVEALHQIDADGIRYLTNTARQAAVAASQHDDEFRAAFVVQRVA